MSDPRALIFVGAHPDDESFGLGATLAHYALQGVKTYYACATRGEVGTVDPKFMDGFDSIGDMRWAELACAAEALGLAGFMHLGYRDSGMPGSPDNQHPQALAAAPLEEATGRVVRVLRDLRPQVVVTFDPIGGYKHPDHIAIHNATVAAFKAAGQAAQYPEAGPAWQPQKLYYQVFPRGIFKAAVRVLPLFGRDARRFGRNHDIDLVDLAAVDFPVHARLSVGAEALERGRAASACHKSQLDSGPSTNGLMGLLFRLMPRGEVFMRAEPAVAGKAPRETDLFAGVA